jgi:hypothetical protein
VNAAVVMAKFVTICTLGILLCGCGRRSQDQYQDRPWADCIYASGKAYVLQGTETLKTTTVLTVHGTYKTFTFPVQRQFDLFEAGNLRTNLGHFVHKASDCRSSLYQFFPEMSTMLALDDSPAAIGNKSVPNIQNLTLQKSFHVDDMLFSREGQSRFCFATAYAQSRISAVNKLTGDSVKLTSASTNFVGDTWHVDLFISDDGRRITRAETDNAKKTIAISAWDIQKEVLLLKPFSVSFTNKFSEPTPIYCEAGDESVLLIASDGRFLPRNISIETFTPDGLRKVRGFVVNLNGPHYVAVKDDQRTVAILINQSKTDNVSEYQWELKRYDLISGDCVHTETVEVPKKRE